METNLSENEQKKEVKRAPTINPEDLHVPDIAWPTVFVFLFSFSLYIASVFLSLRGWDAFATIPLSTLSLFMIFTPLHDAVHRSASKRFRFVNDTIGRLAGIPLMAPFPAFRFIHLRHHKYTNDPENDPDFWSGEGNLVLFYPIQWMLQALHYIPWYYTRYAEINILELIESTCIFGGALGVVIYSVYAECFSMVWQAWMLPWFLSTGMLAYTFDYVPHRPHQISRTQDIYKTTSQIAGLFQPNDINLTIPLLYQNYHNIHHLYPTIPFFQYARVWFKYKDEFLQKGTLVSTVYDSQIPFVKEKSKIQ